MSHCGVQSFLIITYWPKKAVHFSFILISASFYLLCYVLARFLLSRAGHKSNSQHGNLFVISRPLGDCIICGYCSCCLSCMSFSRTKESVALLVAVKAAEFIIPAEGSLQKSN